MTYEEFISFMEDPRNHGVRASYSCTIPQVTFPLVNRKYSGHIHVFQEEHISQINGLPFTKNWLVFVSDTQVGSVFGSFDSFFTRNSRCPNSGLTFADVHQRAKHVVQENFDKFSIEIAIDYDEDDDECV